MMLDPNRFFEPEWNVSASAMRKGEHYRSQGHKVAFLRASRVRDERDLYLAVCAGADVVIVDYPYSVDRYRRAHLMFLAHESNLGYLRYRVGNRLRKMVIA